MGKKEFRYDSVLEAVAALADEKGAAVRVSEVAERMGLDSIGPEGANLCRALLHLQKTGKLSRKRGDGGTEDAGRWLYSPTTSGEKRLAWRAQRDAARRDEA